jgi:uncharacterized membrane protein
MNGRRTDALRAGAAPTRGRGIADDDGSILPLVAGFAALALLVVLVVVGATSLYLDRARLYTLADGAALAGAEAFDLADLDAEGGPQLDPAAVGEAVDAYLAVAPHALDDVTLLEAQSPDGRSATVRLSAMWRPPVVALLLPDGVSLEATSTARSVFG